MVSQLMEDLCPPNTHLHYNNAVGGDFQTFPASPLIHYLLSCIINQWYIKISFHKIYPESSPSLKYFLSRENLEEGR